MSTVAELRPRSVRARTTLLATLVSGAALVAGSLLLLATLDVSLHRAGDDLARGRVSDLAAQAHDGTLPPVLESIGGEGVGQVFAADGTVLAASPNVRTAPAITAPTSSATPVRRTLIDAPDDTEREDYRVWVVGQDTAAGPVTVVAGASLESVGEASRSLRRDLLVAVPLLVLLVAVGTWSVVGRTLRPVERIRTEVAAIDDDDRERRVPVPRTGDEVSRLAGTMNAMLDRLAEAAQRQRAFVADASHEMQSPLTALRTQLETGLAAESPDWPGIARLMLADAEALERLTSNLLYLARTSESGSPRHDLVDLDDVVLEEAARVRSSRAVQVDTSTVSAAPVRGDADELRRMVRNLVENAVRHAASVVRVQLTTDGSTAVLDVDDDGPGVPREHRGLVFDRFYTVDVARARDGDRGSGSGLGLAIARSVALRHGGTLDLVGERGAHFQVVLPAA